MSNNTVTNTCQNRTDLVLYSSAISVAIGKILTSDELNLMGNFLLGLAQNLIIIASETQFCQELDAAPIESTK